MKKLILIFLVFNFLILRGEELKKAPDFTLNSIDGRIIKLSNYKGKKVILNFWAVWCGPCRAEIPDFVKFYNENKNKVEIIGIEVSGKKKDVEEIIKKFNINYPICISDGKIEELYGGIRAVPTTFIIDENGYIKLKKIGIIREEELKEILKNEKK
ncbi:MAG: TlpA family protein disulfide reductase [bacterium]|nr:TlpA family protein disulfide reductase [bacterium]MCX7917135.1 TlpA family protein disulfide reductase [bacterium]MDW8164872.1 TlpA disulfide reductase family protein [Candidatus Omnitrophota bacterium]